MNNPENNKWLDKILGQTIGSEKPQVNFEQWKENHPNAVKKLTSRANDTQVSKHPIKIKEIIMKNPIIRLAFAAVVIIACLIGLSFWKTTGSGIALADVLARVEQTKSIKYETIFKVFGSEDPNELWKDCHYNYLVSKEYGKLTNGVERDPNDEIKNETVEYYYPQQKIRKITINYVKKTYKREEIDNQVQNERSQSQEDIIDYFKDILNTKNKSIGRSIMDGIEVEGFQSVDPNYQGHSPRFLHTEDLDQQFSTKLWIDVRTLLPVRVEYLASILEQPDEDKRIFLQEVNYNFQWDIPVDASTFEAQPILEGYTIQDEFPELANEENAIEGLKQCVELFGRYPEKIDLTIFWAEVEKSETIAALQLKEELKELTGLERDNRKMDTLKPIRFLNKFCLELSDTNEDFAYYGKTVTPIDTDKVLMRWKASDNEYRVIYGDLHAESITPDKLAMLEKQISN